MTDPNSAKVRTGCIGQMNELRLKENDFNSWIEPFELYVNLNKINVHKKQLMFLILYSKTMNLINPKPNAITSPHLLIKKYHGTIFLFVFILKLLAIGI